jgi:hypothetical protein
MTLFITINTGVKREFCFLRVSIIIAFGLDGYIFLKTQVETRDVQRYIFHIYHFNHLCVGI